MQRDDRPGRSGVERTRHLVCGPLPVCGAVDPEVVGGRTIGVERHHRQGCLLAAATAWSSCTPLCVRCSRMRLPSMSSAMRASRRAGTPRRASPSATFAGLPPVRLEIAADGRRNQVDESFTGDRHHALGGTDGREESRGRSPLTCPERGVDGTLLSCGGRGVAGHRSGCGVPAPPLARDHPEPRRRFPTLSFSEAPTIRRALSTTTSACSHGRSAENKASSCAPRVRCGA